MTPVVSTLKSCSQMLLRKVQKATKFACDIEINGRVIRLIKPLLQFWLAGVSADSVLG